MKYVVPVNAVSEVPYLVDAGAAELYCGYQDAWWVERYGDHDSATRRQGAANLNTREELSQMADAARCKGAPLYLALNSRYTEPQLDYLVDLCKDFERMGGTGVIASDLGLLWRLKGNTGITRCLSLLAVAQNTSTLHAYRELGVTRVVLPRFVGPQEAARLLRACGGIEAEVMAFFDKCPWVDGYCRHRHGVSYPDRAPGEDAPEALPLYTFDTTYRTHACLGKSRTYLQPYPCAACHLGQFQAAGVGFAKIGGRGRPLEERLRALRFLCEAEAMQTDEQRQALYRVTFGGECACYYGEAAQSRRSVEPICPPKDSEGRVYRGSETDYKALTAAMDGSLSCCESATTLLIPPLCDSEQEELLNWICTYGVYADKNIRLCANDLGTLVILAQEKRANLWKCELSVGHLLARVDDPVEVERAMDPRANPPRNVWDSDGTPRVLTYRQPPESLVRHWKTPSTTEPSAQAALDCLCGLSDIPYEFAAR